MKKGEITEHTECVRDMIKVICEDIGLPFTYKVPTRRGFVDSVWMLNGVNVGPLVKRAVKGGEYFYSDRCGSREHHGVAETLYPLDTVFDEVYYMVERQLGELGVNVTVLGKKKECEGNGWYSWVDVYEYKGVKYS